VPSPDQAGVTTHHGRRVAPFGDLGITGCQPLPQAFRRVAASFLGCRRQGIHRPPFYADPLGSCAQHAPPSPTRATSHIPEDQTPGICPVPHPADRRSCGAAGRFNPRVIPVAVRAISASFVDHVRCFRARAVNLRRCPRGLKPPTVRACIVRRCDRMEIPSASPVVGLQRFLFEVVKVRSASSNS
jgi:hypothetical protein